MKNARLWIALTRPDNLVSALAVAAAGRDRFASCCLLYENSPWWKSAVWDEFQSVFDKIRSVERVTTCRGLRDLPRFYRSLRDRQHQLVELRIAPQDTIITLSGITSLSNALASAYPAVNKLLCTTVKKYVDANRPYSLSRFRHTTSGWLQYRLLEPWAGLRRTLHLKPWWGGGDGIRLERLEQPLEEVFEAILLLSNHGEELPPGAGPNVFPAPFPSIKDLASSSSVSTPVGRSQPRKVVFFGTPFLLVRNLAPDLYAEHLNACLDYLRRYHDVEYELVYRPHPAETSERGRLRLDRFVIEEDRQVAELYFLRHQRHIEAIYSVSSTVSRVALNYGLNGYALWRNFPFDEAAVTYFESLMGRVPPEFEPATLAQPPREYASQAALEPKATTFPDAVRAVLDHFDRSGVHRTQSREKAVAASLGSPV